MERNPVKLDRKSWYLSISLCLQPNLRIFQYSLRSQVLRPLATFETTLRTSLLYKISRFVLLVTTWTCSETMWNAKIFWPGLSESFSFVLYTSSDNWTFWKKHSFCSKKLFLAKNYHWAILKAFWSQILI